MYWMALIFGVLILAMQLYKYFTNTIELNLQEGCLSGFAVVLMFKPHIISDVFMLVINSKFKKNA